APAAVLDSLAAMQRSMEVLERRVAFMTERARFRQMEARLERGSGEPQGWFGVDVRTLGTSTAQSDGRVLVSADYPRIVSVEPGSPAARAGLAAGDRLISIRGTDLRGQALDLRSVLRPGTRVPVRLERDGVRRDVTVAITVRPSSFSPGTRLRLFAVSPGARGDDGGYEVVTEGAAASAARSASAAARMDAMRSLASARVWRSEAAAPSPITYLFRTSPSVLAVAGAELMRVTEALRASLGVTSGVYVISVAPRTPAEWAGVREGDVIRRADGVAVEAPVDFFRVMQQQTDGLVKLDLMRARRPMMVELRW
ncbi:MAG: PDZ domain-containing protein, partial [Gemmatimonadaceae bacterium]